MKERTIHYKSKHYKNTKTAPEHFTTNLSVNYDNPPYQPARIHRHGEPEILPEIEILPAASIGARRTERS